MDNYTEQTLREYLTEIKDTLRRHAVLQAAATMHANGFSFDVALTRACEMLGEVDDRIQDVLRIKTGMR
jgi:hypothetical protein